MKTTSSLAAGVLAVLLLAPLAYAQRESVYGVEVGYRNPKATQSGFSVGGVYGVAADEAVDLGVGFDFFRRKYTRETEVASQDFPSGVHETTVQRELEYTTTILPIYGFLTIKMPINYSSSVYLEGALGYTFLFSDERNYEEQVEAKRTYHGMSWRMGGGLMHRIGSRSYLKLGVFYHSAEVSREKEESPRGLPIWKSVDLSGIGVRVGVRIAAY